MNPKTINYSFVRGDTQVLDKFRLLDKEGNVISLTEKNSLTFTMKETDEKDAEIILKKTIGDGIELLDDGYYRIVINPEDTEDLQYYYELENNGYVYDIEFEDTSTSQVYIRTIIKGTISLTSEISRRTGGVSNG